MSAWSYGYVSDIGYTYGYYSELNPARAVLPLLQEGLAVPEIKNACELGFGQGVSVNAHAAAGRARWYGTDFNPAHAAFARDLAGVAGTDAVLADQSFEEFCNRDDLPEFEFIGLHGIWSWISDENRRIIVDFIRRKLAVGGILYISYNTLPGWSAHAPIRHLLSMHDSALSSGTHSREQNVRNAVDFGNRVLAQSQGLQQDSPGIAKRMAELAGFDAHYLAHEYLNRDWHPMYFADMAAWLEPAKVGYACSASYFDDFGPCLFNGEQEKLMAEVAQTPLAQTVKDFILNKRFRRDLWVKGARRLNPTQLEQVRKQQRFVLTSRREAVSLTASNYQNTSLIPEIFNPVLDILADGQVHSVAELSERLSGVLNDTQLFTVMMVLHAKNDVSLVQDEATIQAARPRCEAFNRSVLASAPGGGSEINYLVSPINGGAIPAGRIEQMFISAHQQGLTEPAQWAEQVWEILKKMGQRMLKDGETLQSDEDNLAELNRMAAEFAEKRLHAFKVLDIL